MQLKGGELQGQPIGRLLGESYVAEGAPDVAGRLGPKPRRRQHVRDERRRRRLAVGSGDPDAVGALEREEPDVHFSVDLEIGLPCGRERGHIRGHARCDYHRRRVRDPSEVVSTDIHRGSGRVKGRGPSVVAWPGAGVRGVDRDATGAQQESRGDPAFSQPDHRHLLPPCRPAVEERASVRRRHLTLSVESATSAHNKPRM